MALTVTAIAGGQTGANHGTGPASTDLFTPIDNSHVMVVVSAQENSASGTQHNDVGANISLVGINGGAGLTFDKVAQVTWDADGPGGPGAGSFNLGEAIFLSQLITTGSDFTNAQVQADCGALNIYSYVVRIFRISGEAAGVVARAVGSSFDNGPGGAFSFAMDQTPLTDSAVVETVMVGGGSASTITPTAGRTELVEHAPDFQEMQVQWRTGGTDTASWDDVTSSFGSNFGRCGLAVEFAIDDEVSDDVEIVLDPGVYTLAGQDLGIVVAQVIDLEPGVYSLLGQDLDIVEAQVIDLEAGVYSLAGQDLGIIVAQVIDLEAGVYTLAGQDLDIDVDGFEDYEIVLDPGQYSLVGQILTITYSGASQVVRLVALGNFRDTITYWPTPTPDGMGGNSFAPAQTFNARWEQKTELTFDAMGEQFVSQARVYVDDNTELDVGGYLYLGSSAESDPGDQKGAFKIRNFVRTPALRGPRSNNKALL